MKRYLALHSILLLYSLAGVFSKLASGQPFLTLRFCLLYSGVLAILGFYALAWQQIIKRLPLTTAFANKAVTTAWGLVWGALFFHESITLGKVLGVALIILGVALFSRSEEM